MVGATGACFRKEPIGMGQYSIHDLSLESRLTEGGVPAAPRWNQGQTRRAHRLRSAHAASGIVKDRTSRPQKNPDRNRYVPAKSCTCRRRRTGAPRAASRPRTVVCAASTRGSRTVGAPTGKRLPKDPVFPAAKHVGLGTSGAIRRWAAMSCGRNPSGVAPPVTPPSAASARTGCTGAAYRPRPQTMRECASRSRRTRWRRAACRAPRAAASLPAPAPRAPGS